MVSVSAGLGLAIVLSRMLSRPLYRITPKDPGSYSTVAVALTIIARVAC